MAITIRQRKYLALWGFSAQRRKEREGLIIFRKSALLFFAVLSIRRYFGRISGKE